MQRRLRVTSALYRTITSLWILNSIYSLSVLLPTGANATKTLLGLGTLMYLVNFIAPVYFVWRNYDAWKNRTPFLPENIATLAPRAYQLAVAAFWIVAIGAGLAMVSTLLVMAGNKAEMGGAIMGFFTLGIGSSVLSYPVIFIELCFWYQRGFELGNSSPLGSCPTCEQVFDKS